MKKVICIYSGPWMDIKDGYIVPVGPEPKEVVTVTALSCCGKGYKLLEYPIEDHRWWAASCFTDLIELSETTIEQLLEEKEVCV